MLEGKAGTIYKGEWLNNRFHGSGNLVSSDGGRYEGGFAAGEKSGYGTNYYFDGSTYKGGWESNQRHGYGVFTHYKHANQRKEGYWIHDEFTGAGESARVASDEVD